MIIKKLRVFALSVLAIALIMQLSLFLAYDVLGNGFMGNEEKPIWSSVFLYGILLNFLAILLLLRIKRVDSDG